MVLTCRSSLAAGKRRWQSAAPRKIRTTAYGKLAMDRVPLIDSRKGLPHSTRAVPHRRTVWGPPRSRGAGRRPNLRRRMAATNPAPICGPDRRYPRAVSSVVKQPSIQLVGRKQHAACDAVGQAEVGLHASCLQGVKATLTMLCCYGVCTCLPLASAMASCMLPCHVLDKLRSFRSFRSF